jgi:hypothetical protein
MKKSRLLVGLFNILQQYRFMAMMESCCKRPPKLVVITTNRQCRFVNVHFLTKSVQF